MAARDTTAQRLPPASLTGFPTYEITALTDLFRAHDARRSPWWFGNDGGGRFDLQSPRGTCYAALDAESALRERLGPVLGGRTRLPESALVDVVVSRLRLPAARDVADVQSRRAVRFGVTRELESMVPYAVPQTWARALAATGFGGVKYGPRFTPGECSAVGLFGPEGAAGWPEDTDPVPAEQVSPDLHAWPTPRRADVTVVRPPRTRTVRG
ncbi:RES family NAD+ phosphorylase [Nostocoides sp. HKS02]|uniref:RES family NAD+ phosphorylase n=1 Tax=Nostocoides sp. HKS02 TaxID=1813880 RepID=UPI0012B4F212|nr:RES family NAD+ phosphorylase [Tetrasphaera sp. HKS02]QGN57328.1 RES domain-containing protein [Tetrasphaera sp. HKS02]